YFGILETIQSLGLRVLEIPTSPRDGICIDALREALVQHDVKALFVIPSFQNPLGTSMPDAKKEKLYQLLVEFDLPAIEDAMRAIIRADKPLRREVWSREALIAKEAPDTIAARAILCIKSAAAKNEAS
ncbi:MAG: hypothetical protein CFE26_25915, partial [Verrucomicrobiales bacterium VVV1]